MKRALEINVDFWQIKDNDICKSWPSSSDRENRKRPRENNVSPTL
jgi:hypothetical protein